MSERVHCGGMGGVWWVGACVLGGIRSFEWSIWRAGRMGMSPEWPFSSDPDVPGFILFVNLAEMFPFLVDFHVHNISC